MKPVLPPQRRTFVCLLRSVLFVFAKPTHRLVSIFKRLLWLGKISILGCTLAVFSAPSPATAQQNIVKQIEPPSWWIGMRDPKLQLMVHGEQIAQLTAQIHAPGVSLKSSYHSDNPNYLFLDLEIAENAPPGEVGIDFFRGEERVSHATLQLQTRRIGSAERSSFSARDAIYLIVPDRFANGDVDNDSVPNLSESLNRQNPGGRHGGDILGITQHLDYIAGLGFTMLWPTPLVENNPPNYSYHGYAASNLYQIDARFGSNSDYQKLVAEARVRGIGVLQDIVLNHIGIDHWWLKDLPEKDWLNDAGKMTSHQRSTLHDIHAARTDTEQFSNGWFTPTMPDLNQKNPRLATYLIQNTLWWIEYADLSGLRVDTYSYSDRAFLAKWSARVLQEYPKMNMVGEEWSMSPAIIASWQQGHALSSNIPSAMPSMMDFPVYQSLINSLKTKSPKSKTKTGDLQELYDTLALDFVYPHPESLTLFEGNHDTPRLFSELGEDLALHKMALVALATLRGIPQVFYGTEILMRSPIKRDDGKVRADFPGGWQEDKRNAFNGKGLSTQQKSMQDFVRRLFQWRKTAASLHHGKMLHFVPEQNLYVYFRIDEQEEVQSKTVMVILNRNEHPIELDLGRFKEGLKNSPAAYEVLTQSMITLKKTLTVAAKSAQIFELQ